MRSKAVFGVGGIVVALVGVAACRSALDPAAADAARDACVQKCNEAKSSGTDLSNGPCLSDSLPTGTITDDVVCDVAHSPRADVDNQAENQCRAYRDGRASHFVEVDPSCAFLRVK